MDNLADLYAKLEVIFGPCKDCRFKFPVFPPFPFPEESSSSTGGSGSVRAKRKVNASGMNNWPEPDLGFLKDFLKACSAGVIGPNPDNDWNAQYWHELCSLYNDKARQDGFQERTTNELVTVVRGLYERFCDARDLRGYGTTDLDDIFAPCQKCRSRIPVFPTKIFPKDEPGSARDRPNSEALEMNNLSDFAADLDALFSPCKDCRFKYPLFPLFPFPEDASSAVGGSGSVRARPNSNASGMNTWAEPDLGFLKDFLKACSAGVIGPNLDNNWNEQYWHELRSLYNDKACQDGFQERTTNELVKVVGELYMRFCEARDLLGGYGTDLDDIFAPCQECRNRIPVFPANLFPEDEPGSA